MRCPLQFYFRYVAGLQVTQEDTDEVDASQLGNLFHDSAEIIYKDLIRRHGGERTVQKEWLSPLLAPDSAMLRQYVDIAFELNVFHPVKNQNGRTYDQEREQRIAQMLRPDGAPHCEYVGQAIIIRDVVIQ